MKGNRMEKGESFFEFAAYAGYTKHLGGIEATKHLAVLCHIEEGSYVLDVGCGAGVTACFLAKRYGCRVVGIDFLEGMIERSNERAKSEGVEDSVEFRVAEAEDLPFEEDLFDAVITESVTAFPEDKQLAVREYARVTKPGGYIGLNESTWLRVSPPPEVLAWVSQDLGVNVKPLTAEEWVELLEKAELEVISARTYKINVQDEVKGVIRRYGCIGMVIVWKRMLVMYVRNPAYRRFLRGLKAGGITPDNLEEYFGYGLYIGRK